MKWWPNQRAVIRWIHMVLAVPIVGYVYSPFEVIPSYAGPTRLVFVPAMALTGLWMWKGHIVRRIFLKVLGRPLDRNPEAMLSAAVHEGGK